MYLHLTSPEKNLYFESVEILTSHRVNVNCSIITSLFSPLGIANEQKKLYGTQFHPEVDLTERGMEMLRNFLFEIAGCTSNFTVQNRQQACINDIREKVDKSKVLVSENCIKFHECVWWCVKPFVWQRDGLKKARKPKEVSACFNLQW